MQETPASPRYIGSGQVCMQDVWPFLGDETGESTDRAQIKPAIRFQADHADPLILKIVAQ
jgi:hypothetical protein